MTAVPAAIKAAPEPQVNLLPPEVAERRSRGRRRGFILFAFVVFIAGAVAAVFFAGQKQAAAQKALDDAITEGQRLQTEIDSYSPVVEARNEVASTQSALTYVGATEIRLSDLMREFAGALPDDVTITGITWNPQTIVSWSGYLSGPFDAPDIGSISVSGIAPSYLKAADLEERLNRVPQFARTRIPGVAASGEGDSAEYAFTAEIRITALALSGRFGSEWMIEHQREQAPVRLDAAIAQAKEDYLVASGAATEAETDPLTDETVVARKADVDRGTGALAQVEAIAAAYEAADDAVDAAAIPVSYGIEGAEDAQAEAVAARDALAAVFDPLATAAIDWSNAYLEWADVNARIAAAQELVDGAEARVAAAEASVAAGDAGADEELAAAQTELAIANAILANETGYLGDAETTLATAEAALDAAVAEAAAIVPVTVPEEPEPVPDEEEEATP